MKSALVAIWLIASIGGAVASPAHDQAAQLNAAHHQQLVSIVRGVDLKAGVTQAQADAIAELYFSTYIATCGRARPAVDRGAQWEITPLLGFAGTPDKHPIIVGKHTGNVSWQGGPSFSAPSALLGTAP
jgi:hypothetical protein